MTRPSVLIVTYGFPPHIKSLGGAIRMLKLAEYLQKKGCNVHVLCARTPYFDTFGYDELLASLSVTRLDDPITLAGSRVFKADEKFNHSAATPIHRIKSWFKQAIIEALTPDTAILMVRRMQRGAQRIVAAQPKLTLITSGPPHSIHLVGHRLKHRYPSIKWIADYRDSWNGTSLFRKRNPLLQRLNQHFERMVLASCDHFSYISTPMLDKAKALTDENLATKSKLIANGFDESLLLAIKPMARQSGTLHIGYFGAIDDTNNSYRNPTSIFEAIIARPELDVRLEFYGSINISSDWKDKLGERLHIGSRLSHRDAIDTMASMDALLLLHTREDGADEVVTGKVFEYIASALSIISIGPKNMAVNELLANDPSAFCANHLDTNAIATLIANLLELKQNNTLPLRTTELITSFTREHQFEKFMQLINEHAK